MARPKANQITERELEVMQVFWDQGAQTAAEAQSALAERKSRELAYTTVATLIKILVDKGFLKQTNDKRPFTYAPIRSFKDVSSTLVGDLINRVFGGSREQLLIRMLEQKKLSKKERQLLEDILKEKKS
ncbi:MAG: BlaI/MecI/CopY family transcriptional regulator [Planctomycetota bacterium]